jgi:hypothetical protein
VLDRQAEVDPSERIAAACEGLCPQTTVCDPSNDYDTVEVCIAGCIDNHSWDDLDQCDWAETGFMICLGSLSCQEYIEYNALVMGACWTSNGYASTNSRYTITANQTNVRAD